METPSQLKGIKATLGDELFQKITSCKILLVGSGGIGCELLKNLALSGFTHVEVIDLDTIDVSNLNRQFLFRRHHVGMPKCKVGCEAALAMLPTPAEKATYKAHHGNVCDNSRFHVGYVKGFDLVLNALDNVTARRRVNRLCLAASVPLIEAGTTGYLGQVTVIDKSSNTECYECQAKPTQKVYPICTIRSTPSMPVHTIVWAKELYKLLFGPKVEDSMLFEDGSGDEKSTYMEFVETLRSLLFVNESTSVDMAEIREVTKKVLVSMNNTEIQKQLDMDRFKTAQKVPTPVPVEMIESIESDTDSVTPMKREGYKQTDVLSQEDCIAETISCILDASAILASGNSLLPEFDKDDILAMRFITCTSNLRSYIFGIDPIQSYYSAKGIAGNIIPAIATTNAIVAGLQVLQAFHILRKQLENKADSLKDVCKYIYCLRDKTRKGYYLQPTTLPDPNPNCFVCRSAKVNLSLNTGSWTLEMLLRRILKKELGFMEPSITIGSSVIHEEGEGAEEEAYAKNLSKLLKDLPAGGVKNGSVINIEDFTQDLEVDVIISHIDKWEAKDGDEALVIEEEEKFVIGGKKPTVNNSSAISEKTAEGNINSDDEDIEIVLPEDNAKDKSEGEKEIISTKENGANINVNGNGKKRMLEIDDNEAELGAPRKVAKVTLN